jgi:hypothetical protein
MIWRNFSYGLLFYPHKMVYRFFIEGLAVLVLLFGVCCSCEASTTPASTDKGSPTPPAALALAQSSSHKQSEGLIEPSDLHYGVYLKGQKVGWMRSQTLVGKTVQSIVDVEAKITGLGTTATITMHESRHYNRRTKQLDKISYSQRAQTGEMRIDGERLGDVLDMSVSAGGQVTRKKLKTQDNLQDLQAVLTLAREGKVGDERQVQHFDAGMLKTVTVKHRVVERDKRMFGGVLTPIVQISSHFPELGIEEKIWVDHLGTLLESRIGGFFIARLESETVAKQLDYSQDLLISAVVPLPPDTKLSQNMTQITLEMDGFGKNMPPQSPRQKVSLKGERVILKLSRDQAPQGIFTPKRNTANEFLESTAFIQSDNPKIVAHAREAIGSATTNVDVIERLTRFVYHHIKDEYVPSYSNALEALNTGRGDCTEHSILFVALARALGLPARVAVGIAYWPAGGGFGWHAWSEVEVGGRWISVDPTWNQPISDATHIKLADGSPAQQAKIVMLLGQLKVHRVETAAL